MTFTRSLWVALAAAGTLIATAPSALAQEATPSDDPLAPTPVPAPPAEPFVEPDDEIPQAPTFGDEEPPPPPPVKAVLGYPGREVDRPVSLPSGVGEVALDFKFGSLPQIGGLLRLRYGITPRVQFGLIYGGLAAYDKPKAGGGTSFQVAPGKSIGVELQVVVAKGIAVRATTPMYLDPYAAGLSLGAPLHVKLGKKFALIGMEEIVSFRIHKFLPSLRSEATNTAQAAAVEANGVVSDGLIRLVPGLIYQVSDKLSAGGTFGLVLFDFGDAPTGVELKGRVLYNVTKRIDLWGTAGFDNLDDASDNAAIEAGVAIRL